MFSKLKGSKFVYQFNYFENKEVFTPLHWTIRESNVEMFKLLLNNDKVNINLKGSIGVLEDHRSLNDYDVNNFTTYFKDIENELEITDYTPLEYAKQHQSEKMNEIIKLLTQKCAK